MSEYTNDVDSTDSELREAATILNDAAVKERLAEQIVSNSLKYDATDDVIEDFPTKKSLATKAGQVAPFSELAEQVKEEGTATNTDNSDDLKMFGSDSE